MINDENNPSAMYLNAVSTYFLTDRDTPFFFKNAFIFSLLCEIIHKKCSINFCEKFNFLLLLRDFFHMSSAKVIFATKIIKTRHIYDDTSRLDFIAGFNPPIPYFSVAYLVHDAR